MTYTEEERAEDMQQEVEEDLKFDDIEPKMYPEGAKIEDD